ncbi:MAG: starch-binding protein [Ruminococcus sp.]|nr:starch-binding protein [Ruminococcus sp.]
MVKKKHRVLSLILCLMLALSAVFASTASVAAAAGDTVYVRLNNGWSQVYIYMWNSTSDTGVSWPGEKMTQYADGVYSYHYNKDFKYVIFNNGSGAQTADLTYTGNGGDGKIYDLSKGTWSDYQDATKGSTTATTATTATTPTTPSGSFTLYLDNQNDWSNPCCYVWNDSTDAPTSWPGAKMTFVGEKVWQFTAPKTYAKCIFSNGGGNQTADLNVVSGQIYDNKTGKWSVYDTSDLQVKSFSADPASNVYAGTDVTLTASAQSVTGATVVYSFVVTDPNGKKTTVSDFSTANSVVWTPAASGTYTINFEFKDSDGNTNSRSTTLAVLDDSSLAKPIIKGVNPADLNYISNGRSTTVTVKAGGGITGTNLLFYKYIVTNPDGTTNTPYYTLNNTYSFTPNGVGTYKVQVFVQASDNVTVNKTYNYVAINGAVPTNTVSTLPTSATVATKPTTATVATTAKPTTKPTVKPTTVPTTTRKPVTGVAGDANRDGILSVLDVTHIQGYLVQLPAYAMDEDTKILCDMDKDGVLSIKDATYIQKKLVGLPY